MTNNKTKRNPARKYWAPSGSCVGLKNFDEPQNARQRARNKEVCLGCPVLDNCLEYVLAYKDEKGFWAGTTDSQRKEIRRSLPPVALSLVHLESHSSIEFASAFAAQNAPIQIAPPEKPFELAPELYSLIYGEL